MATNPMQRKARNSFLLGMLVMLLISGAVIAFLVLRLVSISNEEKKQEAAQKNVYILKGDIKAGQVIDSTAVIQKKVDASVAPSNAITNYTNIQITSLTDQEGNAVKTEVDEETKQAKLTIVDSETETQKEVKYDVVTDEQGNPKYNYYVENTITIGDGQTTTYKEYIELNQVPLVAKVDLKANTVITTDLIAKTDEPQRDDLRKQEYNMFVLPTQIASGDFVDVRISMPSGSDYIVVSKKEVTVPVDGAGMYLEDTVWMNLTEEEILNLNCAIVEAYKIKGSKLYLTTYTDPGLQKAATPTYIPNAEVSGLIDGNPNIIQTARDALVERYNNNKLVEQRNTHIQNILNDIGEEAQANLEAGVEESATNAATNRKNYLDSLAGAATSTTGTTTNSSNTNTSSNTTSN